VVSVFYHKDAAHARLVRTTFNANGRC
jgi:hypothetical protein